MNIFKRKPKIEPKIDTQFMKYICSDALRHCVDVKDYVQNKKFWFESGLLTREEEADLLQFYRFWARFTINKY